ncbi:MAG: AAA family ATPase [Vulcanimicrobiaceae bacterium]
MQRPHVAQALHEALSFPFVLVHGPIGSGKSSSVALALASDARPVVWHQVQPWHADDFVKPLVDAIRERRPDFGRRTLALAENARNDALAAQRLGASLCEDLAHLSEPIVLAIDDAHLLIDDSQFAGFIESAARTLPSQAHLVVMTRASAQFAIGELIAQRRAKSFDANLLRFSATEIRDLAESRGANDERITAIISATEGWPVAVSLALDYGDQSLPSAAAARTIRAEITLRNASI